MGEGLAEDLFIDKIMTGGINTERKKCHKLVLDPELLQQVHIDKIKIPSN